MPLSKFGEISGIISSNIFPAPFFFFSWDSDEMNVRLFIDVLRILKDLFILFSLFFCLLFKLGNFYSSVFKFTGSFLYFAIKYTKNF